MSGPAPVTTRVGGGFSPRLAAAIFAVGLAGIVAAAFVNRPPAQPNPAFMALSATPTPTAAGLARAPAPPTDAPLPNRTPRGIENQADAFAAIIMIGGRQYPILLEDDGQGTLDGWARLPYPRPDMQGTVQLAQLWSRGPDRNFQSIGQWTLPLDLLMPEVRTSGTALTVDGPAEQRAGDNRLTRGGFQLDVRLESRTDFGMIFVTLTVPVATADAQPHHQIIGEDGIFGLPGWPWRADDTPTAHPSRYVFNFRAMGPGHMLTR